MSYQRHPCDVRARVCTNKSDLLVYSRQMGDNSDAHGAERDANIASMQESINELVKANSQLTQLLMAATAATKPNEKVADPQPAKAPVAIVPAACTYSANSRRRAPPPKCRGCCCQRCGDKESYPQDDACDLCDASCDACDAYESNAPSPFFTCMSSMLELLLQIILAVILVTWFLGGTLFTAIV